MESLGLTSNIINFWKNKKVLITGHTGFKGSWMTLCLLKMGAEIYGVSKKDFKCPSLYSKLKLGGDIKEEFVDIRQYKKLEQVIKKFKPEVIFHLAAQSLVLESYKDPIETYTSNINGTINILDICKNLNFIKSIIIITSDKCYENLNTNKKFNENDHLGGSDPYSSSKACADIIANAYYQSFFKNKKTAVVTCRAGNVIGGHDWANNRLIPDTINAIRKNKKLKIRMPFATRPWQFVLEPIFGYLAVARLSFSNPHFYSGAYNFGPNTRNIKSVEWVIKEIYKQFDMHFKLSLSQSKKTQKKYESKYLRLNNTKAKSILKWNPVLTISQAIKWSVDVYKIKSDKIKLKELCFKQISTYEKKQNYDFRKNN
ncbi:WcaG Nucleoside-diphosphate-sugar epimerases [Candidatus Methylopumilus universalis]